MPWSQTPPSPMAVNTLSTLGKGGDQGPPPGAPQAHQHHHHAGLLGLKLRGEEKLDVVGRGRRSYSCSPTPEPRRRAARTPERAIPGLAFREDRRRSLLRGREFSPARTPSRRPSPRSPVVDKVMGIARGIEEWHTVLTGLCACGHDICFWKSPNLYIFFG